LQPGYEYGEQYEFGLDLILDGLQSSLHQEEESDRRGAAASDR
jgi:hypothetical protein